MKTSVSQMGTHFSLGFNFNFKNEAVYAQKKLTLKDLIIDILV